MCAVIVLSIKAATRLWVCNCTMHCFASLQQSQLHVTCCVCNSTASQALQIAFRTQVQNLCKEYQVKDTVFTAVQDATLDFPANQIIALLGPSGSGKTTLLRLIAGLESVTRGQIFFGGKHQPPLT